LLPSCHCNAAREIGIRKTLGSTVPGVIMLLSRDFILPVLVAIALACPLCWWLMTQWLQSFPYHTHINAGNRPEP
jgi:putative ABC transport system permease protein